MYKFLGIDSCKGFRYRTALPSGKEIVSWQGAGYSGFQKFFSRISGISRDNHQGFLVNLLTSIIVNHVRYNSFFIYFSDGKVTVSTDFVEKN